MDEETLNSILQENIKPNVSFLSDINKENSVDTEIKTNAKNQSNETKIYKCSKCSYETTKLTELMLHSRREHPKPKIPKEKPIIDDIEPEVNTNMEDTNTLELIPETEVIEVESAKPKGKSSQKAEVEKPLPTLYNSLEDLLKGYGVRGYKGIMQTAALHDISKPEFIPILKDSIRGTATPGVIGPIADAWALRIGTKPEGETRTTLSSSISGQVSTNEVDGVLRQMELDEARSLAMSSRRSMIEERELNNELKRKRLAGELMDPKNTDSDRLRIELELLKLQMNQQPKSNPELDMLKLELERLKVQNSQPKTDPQVEALRLQIEQQNKRNEELQRKIDEDAREARIRDEARRNQETFDKRFEDLARQNQEIIKAMQTNSAPKTEDILTNKITEMQRLYNEQISQLKNDFLSTRKDEVYKAELERSKEEIRQLKEGMSEGVGSLAGSIKDFTNAQRHESEMLRQEVLHQRQVDDIKNQLEKERHNKTLTNEQYAFEKTQDMLANLGKGLKETVDNTLGQARVPAEQAAKTAAAYDRAQLALNLKAQGFAPDQITKIVGESQVRPQIPSAASEWQKLQEASNREPQITMQPENIQPSEIPSEQPVGEVKFNTND